MFDRMYKKYRILTILQTRFQKKHICYRILCFFENMVFVFEIYRL